MPQWTLEEKPWQFHSPCGPGPVASVTTLSSVLSHLPTLGCAPNLAPTQTDSLLTDSKPGGPDSGSWSEDAVNPIGYKVQDLG